MFNMISLPNCQDVKKTLQDLRLVFSSASARHFNSINPRLRAEESYLSAWAGLTTSGLSADEYFQRYAYTLSADVQQDAKAYLLTMQSQQRSLKEVNFIAINNGNKISGFIIYHILEMNNETIFQIRQCALSNELVAQLVHVLMNVYPYAIYEAIKANVNTIPMLNALHKAQLAAVQENLIAYNTDSRHYSTSHGMFKPYRQDPAYPTVSSALPTTYPPRINVR